MCGIFGYVGAEKKDLSNFLVDGLQKLEYRGYDSAGIGILQKNKAYILRSVGEVSILAGKLKGERIAGQIGIGHTRWATHGGVTEKNSHPHLDCTRQIVVVHNGIIENYKELKKELLSKKHKFTSETDTEVVAHLVEEELKSKTILTPQQFARAVYKVFKKLKGLNAIIVGSVKAQCLVVFRKGSPISIGVARDSYFISSDLPTLAAYTKTTVFLEEGEGVLIVPGKKATFFDAGGRATAKKPGKITFHYSDSDLTRLSDKGKYDHFMLKEIHEQGQSLARIADYPRAPIARAADMIFNAYGTYFTACGTAAYAGLAATYFFSNVARWHVNFAVGSEFYFLEDFLVPKSLLIVASQSGETMDTLEAVRAAKKHKSRVVSLVNVPGSTLTRLSDFSLELLAGLEKAVASTKAYTAKLAVFLLLAYALAKKPEEGFDLISRTQKEVNKMFKNNIDKNVYKIAKKIYKSNHIFVIGREANYPTALEAALKIKEVSYIHAEGFAGGELKHGVIALISSGTPCIVFVANDASREDVLANAMELKSRGGYMIGIGTAEDSLFDEFIKVPDVGFASPIVNIIPAQLLAYHLAVLRGNNPDKPRNLAKSVVVK